MIKGSTAIKPPTSAEKLIIRIMIFIGIVSMMMLLFGLFNPKYIEQPVLYGMIMTGFVYLCLATLFEWYYYFSISAPKIPDQSVIKEFKTVDIFTTFFPGEPYKMLEETLKAIQKIPYPHKTYLCDEANDEYLKELCAQLDVIHVIRENRIDAKAGNINNALKQSNGELCVILDPDHVCQPDFLDKIVPYFSDPQLAYVQIVQAYKNYEESLIAKGAAQQTYQFYGPMMMCMNSYGTVQSIGANCTFRRTALNSIGGHAAGLAEDLHTAMLLHSKGWKSLYLPLILTRGLVPSTLSAYYKQQLKWARGTFELWITTYLKKFWEFNLRQKIHYGLIPFYYISGIIFFLNFLVPVLSLLLGIIPLEIDIIRFILLATPFLLSVILIRHFVQRWVMEENERGFHVVGGLLQIGTWWVYVVALYYTIRRKKVPYDPTPKDGKEKNNWPLNIPNMLVAVCSLIAIIYGLNLDFNPYSLFMAFLATINILCMTFIVVASREAYIRTTTERYKFIQIAKKIIKSGKIRLWVLRHVFYSGLRKAGLAILSIAMASSIFLMNFSGKSVEYAGMPPEEMEVRFYNGIFFPAAEPVVPSIDDIKKFEKKLLTKFDIVALTIRWNDDPNRHVPNTVIKDIYSNNSLPLITWEPWTGTFAVSPIKENLKDDKGIFNHITDGFFDSYIKTFARDLKELERPVFLRFANEFDNVKYPWSPSGNNSPEEFKAAWKYVQKIFKREGAYNVIWIWNPFKPETASEYFPGKEYVDWIGVTAGNNDPHNEKVLYDIYSPFAKQKEFQQEIPVMLLDFRSLDYEEDQKNWIKNAIDIIPAFPEIKAFIHLQSSLDQKERKGISKANMELHYDHSDSNIKIINTIRNHPLRQIRRYYSSSSTVKNNSNFFKNLRGVNYRKGLNWFKNYHTLTRHEVEKDFAMMQNAGINTIKRAGPGIYDNNILSVAKKKGLQVHYSFWTPGSLNFLNDDEGVNQLNVEIIATIKKYQHLNSIVAWHIGNDIWTKLKKQYAKPELLYHQQAYLNWLAQISETIKHIDPARPLTVDLGADDIIPEIELLSNSLINFDGIGLVEVHKDDSLVFRLAEELKMPLFYSEHTEVSPSGADVLNIGIYINGWQDIRTKVNVTFDGLIDHWGRPKSSYYDVINMWSKKDIRIKDLKVKILKPAVPVFKDKILTYNALIYINGQWEFFDDVEHDFSMEWYLVKQDIFGNALSLERLDEGSSLDLQIPGNYSQYQLYFVASDNNLSSGARSALNTPLF